jgi:2'-5' RNA ligase
VALGFPPEERPWSAHVTLGRYPGRPPEPPPLDPRREFGRARADRLVLFRSTLAPEGALHEPLRELSLLRAK